MGPTDPKAVTYCLSQTVILTRRCAYACGYCDFPVRSSRPLPSLKAVRKRVRRAAQAGAVQVLLTAGEGIADIPETVGILRYYGLDDYTQYLNAVFQETMENNGWPGLFPLPHVGNLSFAQLQQIKGHVPCVRIFLESADSSLLYHVAHGNSPCKAPQERLETILHAGQVGIPVTSGILVGIGESRPSRERALLLIAEAHRQYGHVQNIAIERFVPRPNTPMADWPPAPPEEVLWSIRAARRIFGPHFPITFSVLENVELLDGALEAGADDFGDVEVSGSPQADNDTLQRLHLVRSHCESRGVQLQERLPIFPSHQTERWLSPQMLELVRAHREHLLVV